MADRGRCSLRPSSNSSNASATPTGSGSKTRKTSEYKIHVDINVSTCDFLVCIYTSF